MGTGKAECWGWLRQPTERWQWIFKDLQCLSKKIHQYSKKGERAQLQGMESRVSKATKEPTKEKENHEKNVYSLSTDLLENDLKGTSKTTVIENG